MIYEDGNRGKYQFADRARQLIRFDDMIFGNITPTDIDGLIEYHNKAFILYEFKHGDAEIPKGQKLALERMVDAFTKSGKKAVAFLCKHSVDNPDKDIRAADAIVKSIYWNGAWHSTNGITVLEQTKNYLKWINKEESK